MKYVIDGIGRDKRSSRNLESPHTQRESVNKEGKASHWRLLYSSCTQGILDETAEIIKSIPTQMKDHSHVLGLSLSTIY